jgi:hypothetical protein
MWSRNEVIDQSVAFQIAPSRSLASQDGCLGLITGLLPWGISKKAGT